MVLAAHYRPPFDAHSDRTLAALLNAAKGFGQRSAELDAAVCEYVAYLKAAGLPAEHVLMCVKEVIARSGIGRDPDAMNVIIDGVVTLCIEEFYKNS